LSSKKIFPFGRWSCMLVLVNSFLPAKCSSVHFLSRPPFQQLILEKRSLLAPEISHFTSALSPPFLFQRSPSQQEEVSDSSFLIYSPILASQSSMPLFHRRHASPFPPDHMSLHPCSCGRMRTRFSPLPSWTPMLPS